MVLLQLGTITTLFYKNQPMLKISDSQNIAVLDSSVTGDLCAGKFYINITPSVWITSIASVLGVKYEIINPYGVSIRPYPQSTYDTLPFEFDVPTQAGSFQYGKYTINVKLVDSGGKEYVDSKSLTICAPSRLDKTKKYGSVDARLTGVCKDGKVYVLVDNVPVYNGSIAESTDQSFTFDYPSGSLASFTTTYGSFTAKLFEGVYKIKGDICATYSFGDNTFVKVKYKVEYSKPILCALDECCVFEGLQVLNDRLNSDCSEAEKKDTKQRIETVTLLLSTIDFGVRCGDDISEYILHLQDILTVSCGCDFNNGTPIGGGNPAADVLIQGCNVESEVVGLTTVYTINNYEYKVKVSDNGGALTAQEATINGCVKEQQLIFNIDAVYTQIKGKANADSTSWGAIVMKSLTGMDGTCLGITAPQLAAMSFKDFIQKVVDKACAGGSTCIATTNSASVSQNGADAIISFANTGAFSSDIYVDGVLKATVLGGVTSYTLKGYADGVSHTYKVFAKCANGSNGTSKDGSFGFTGCPTIAQPTVSSTNVTAECPYNLTGLVMALPVGITAEWHNANNTLPSSLINPNSVSDGVYYVFATNGSNCYSTGVKVTVICQAVGSCTAPQSLVISPMIGGLLVAFQSASYPPPSNSYTVQRKLQAQSDASYVTMGAPTFNVSTNKWEYKDLTAVANKYYSYRAISNCVGGGKSISVDYANFTCVTPTLTVTQTAIGYSFTPSGGDIDSYQIILTDAYGNAVDTDTVASPFGGTVTGSFTALTANTDYNVQVVPAIGAVKGNCPKSSVKTNPLKVVTLLIQNESLDISLTGIEIDAVTPTFSGGALPVMPYGGATSQGIFAATVSVKLTWTNSIGGQSITVFDSSGAFVQCIPSGGAGGTVTITGVDNTGEQSIFVQLSDGACV